MLVTPRLRLAPIAPSDARELLALFRDPQVRKYLLDDVLVGEQWISEELVSSWSRFRAGSVGLFAAREPRDGALVGVAGFRPFLALNDLQLLYAVDPEASGRGLATEMVAAVVDYAFDAAELDSIRAAVDEPNEASLRLLVRLGFRPITRRPGARFELVVFEMTAEEWRAARR
ncbi:MAG TPA: GNAT family N-acetyltransferase [Thermoanaerobaculia bacterium]|nr:GNAT family N-acetyltransferase [Thermoanaerobaculia bacterium]